jgi:hypothetical protein
LPFFCILAAIGIKELTLIFKQKKVFILPIILIFVTIFPIKQLAEFINTEAGNNNLPIAAKTITSSKAGGLIVPFWEGNDINVQTISFYVAINDPRLEFSVFWPVKLEQANYIISQEEINLLDTKLIFSKDELYVFKRTK